MDLIAKDKVEGWESKLYNISDIFFMRDEAAILDRKFRESLNKSLDENGMKFPILVTDSTLFKSWVERPHIFPKPLDVSEPYRCVIGNNRMHWASSRGYTRIQAIYVSSKEEKQKVLKLTEMEYGRDF